MEKIIFVILLFYSNLSHAGFNISINKSYFKPQGWEYVSKNDRFASPTISYGYSRFIDSKYFFNVSTNRLVSHYGGKKDIISNGALLTKNTKPTIDSFKAGYRIGRNIASFDIYNVKLESDIYYNNYLIAKSEKDDIIFGNSYSFLITKKVSGGLSIIYPSEKLDLDYGISTNISYSF